MNDLGSLNKGKKSASFWVYLLVIILTAAVAGGATWYFVDTKASKDKDDLQTQIDDLQTKVDATSTSTSAASTAAVTDATKDWKTYTNSTYGFSFKYPANLATKSGVSKDRDLIFAADDGNGHWTYEITTTEADGQTLDQLVASEIKDMTSDSSKAKTTDLMVDSISAKKVIVDNIGDYGNALVTLIKGNSVFTIKGDVSTQPNKADFDNLVQTFQFTAAATSNGLKISNLKNATYSVGGAEYKLTSGTYTHPGDSNMITGVGPFAPDVPGTINLDQNHIAIDSANADQAATILQIGYMRHGGATLFPAALEIMTNDSGSPKYLASVILNDYFTSTINSVTFASNTVTISLTNVASPSATKTVVYKLSANKLVLQ